ncbi:hypothetical protein [Sporomusa acidovorans]|uniref:Uncharacterized protein n=1 Tax=Sporomusa acidovorans (strain ATCC 49682 / DSM 3132 / Mol) TaxID=1123286 RepID=A0ABZ3IWZ4_SPOA4|nr:hypothetical protein [Sporomusa acidovorans]OZC23328.1 hypothetical protein SPACI_07400 [Sporomusa acidovorans DSM 3132]SDE41990.1 hypothetical protein SAMN04488499_101342 [Sporomusa acidovorans]
MDIAALTGTLLSGASVAEAAPVSGYKQFVESLDNILSGTVIPIAEEQETAVRQLCSLLKSMRQLKKYQSLSSETLVFWLSSITVVENIMKLA